MDAKRYSEPPRRDRYSASIVERAQPLTWFGLVLVILGSGYAWWHHASPNRGAQAVGEAGSTSRILSVRGGVEYRRGDHGAWQRARSGVRLTWGDWIKSMDDGRAEIRFPGGSTYELLPATVARLDQLSDRSSDPGGLPEAAAALDLEWVDLDKTLPPDVPSGPSGPLLVSPASDHEIDLTTQKQLRLAWEKKPAANRYALNVSSSPSFASNIIEDTDRHKPSARIGIRGEGVFYWRVAAFAPDGSRGAWSEIRSFRVTDPSRVNRG